MKRAFAALVAATVVSSLVGCSSGGGNPLESQSSSAPGTITVGSANFLENVLLGEMYAIALTNAGYKVDTKLNIGSREVIYDQVEKGALSVLPEYNGALLAYVDPKDTASTLDAVNASLAAKLPKSLALLTPSPAEDKDTVVVRKETADKDKLVSIADLAPLSPTMSFGAAPEDRTRQQGLVGLESEYGIKFKSFKALDTAGPLTITALANGDVDAALLYSTTPEIASRGFVALTDPKNVFGVQNVVPLVNSAAVDDKARDVLNKISAALDTETLTQLNKRVQIDNEDAKTVAEDWLKSKGLA
ncbi:ABC transporter substrate-binding protein [Mycobacterium yunnanensis]|uniref:ABC transporter substrate-binding protein n=1 Tax=Mycobacterium yunnanensis TaxID=368477 RepID=A0A9X3C3B6_9MYCO|nr:ABC transporter substrate-binding protein [Mycobacterium yunnanensis]MCV7421822.1 ABC transporter substrate-binding protein [Mycobacterium yunnanensis]